MSRSWWKWLLFVIGVTGVAWWGVRAVLSSARDKQIERDGRTIMRILGDQEARLMSKAFHEKGIEFASRVPRDQIFNPALGVDVFPVDAFGVLSANIPRDHNLWKLFPYSESFIEPTPCRFVVFREFLPKVPPTAGEFNFNEVRAVCPCSDRTWSLLVRGTGDSYDFSSEHFSTGDGLYIERCHHKNPLVALNQPEMVKGPRPPYLERNSRLERAESWAESSEPPKK